MGYRVRLGKIPKSARDKYAGKTEKEVDEIIDVDGGASYRLPEYTELYEIGKYVDHNKFTEPFYDFVMCDTEFVIMSKEGLLNVINEFREGTRLYYENLKEEDFEEFKRRRLREWSPEENFGVLPYWLDEEHTDGEIVRSWIMEYAIFNIVHIYRTFDWENDFLIYSGW